MALVYPNKPTLSSIAQPQGRFLRLVKNSEKRKEGTGKELQTVSIQKFLES